MIELVLVVAILGIVGAIAVPRLSRGAEGATESATVFSLTQMRIAIEMYAQEHCGTYPTAKDIEDQLTKYTDIHGNTSDKPDKDHIYGPYLRAIPELQVGKWKGERSIKGSALCPPKNESGKAGWLYHEESGNIWANATDFLGY